MMNVLFVLLATHVPLVVTQLHNAPPLYQAHPGLQHALLAQLAPTLTPQIEFVMPAQQASTEAQPLPTGDHIHLLKTAMHRQMANTQLTQVAMQSTVGMGLCIIYLGPGAMAMMDTGT